MNTATVAWGLATMSPFELRWQNTACFSGSIDKARVGQKGDAYFVNYPPGSNNRRMLQFHIERGNSREPRYCMRIYFFSGMRKAMKS